MKTIKEIYEKIIELSKSDSLNEDEQHVIESKVEELIELANNKLRKINDVKKEEVLLPLFDNFYVKKSRHLLLRTLEGVTTEKINNFLFNESLLENDVSGVIPYLQVFGETTDKAIIKDKANDLYVSGKFDVNTKQFNNLCTLLFYIGIRDDVKSQMVKQAEVLDGIPKEIVLTMYPG